MLEVIEDGDMEDWVKVHKPRQFFVLYNVSPCMDGHGSMVSPFKKYLSHCGLCISAFLLCSSYCAFLKTLDCVTVFFRLAIKQVK